MGNKKTDHSNQTISKEFLNHKQDNFFIVGLGASAGGLEAFESFFTHMPPDVNIAFIVISHLAPTKISILPELIQKCTQIPVFTIEDGIKINPNSIYVVPSNNNVAIFKGVLQLLDITKAENPDMPIDFFFKTLAQDQKEMAIGIVLSGMGTDGTIGLKAIKNELGMIMAQQIDTAAYISMPQSAISTGIVDYILPPASMPEQLIKFVKHTATTTKSKIDVCDGKMPDALQKIFIILRSITGHDFSAYKQNTICRRIERRMNIHQIDDISNYVRYLQQNRKEVEILFKELLIGVTNFFRDPESFDNLKEKIFSELLADKPNDYTIRIWVAGCSTGEEAYSIAILVKECMDELNKYFNVQIFATDIDSEAVETARAGKYPIGIAANVEPKRLKQFFSKQDDYFIIQKHIREMLIFAPQNIIKDPPFTKLDLLSCRNLLIYLDADIQKKLFPIFHYALNPGGFLFLGNSESIGSNDDLFTGVNKKWKIYKRKDDIYSRHTFIEFPLDRSLNYRNRMQPNVESNKINHAQIFEKFLLKKYAPPAAIINNKGEIIYIHGKTGKYLEPASGNARMNIFEMAREGLKIEVSIAVRKAISEKKEIFVENIRVKGNGEYQHINLTVAPIDEPLINDELFTIIFEDILKTEKISLVKVENTPETDIQDADKHIKKLEEELQSTKENLQTTIEEIETSNEELQSTNEELQSANEELETSKEEQQSLNEELVTVNSELQGKINDLSKTSDDMRNLLDGINIPIIFLDNNLYIKRFTAQATKIINLIQSDSGRSISHIASNLKYENFIPDLKKVLKTLAYREKDVQTYGGLWYKMRIFPYRTIDNIIDGVVITFIDIHANKESAQKIDELNKTIEKEQQFKQSIFDTLKESIIILDVSLKIISANRSFYRQFRILPDETIGNFIYDIANHQWDIAQFRELLEKVILENKTFDDFVIEYVFPDIGSKKIRLNARKIGKNIADSDMILLAIENF
ncbi:MAG: PAS domain-containing protein [Desulfobacterales bacterium]|nr:PAS domain-containing protein [Desulfobacterales bacterium]